MSFLNLQAFRAILDTETDNMSPGSEELFSQLRENFETLLLQMFDTGVSGSATENPPDDTTGVLTDSNANYAVNRHNGRTLLITSGTAKGNIYTIDDTTATTIVCTDDNLYSDGVRSGDTYKVMYDLKVNTDGHNHDGVNSKTSSTYKFKTGTFTGEGELTQQAITGVGFKPVSVWVFYKPTSDTVWNGPAIKISEMGIYSYHLAAANDGEVSVFDDVIDSFDTDGFTIGSFLNNYAGIMNYFAIS